MKPILTILLVIANSIIFAQSYHVPTLENATRFHYMRMSTNNSGNGSATIDSKRVVRVMSYDVANTRLKYVEEKTKKHQANIDSFFVDIPRLYRWAKINEDLIIDTRKNHQKSEDYLNTSNYKKDLAASIIEMIRKDEELRDLLKDALEIN